MYASEPTLSPRTTFWTALVIAILAMGFAMVTGYWLLYRLSYALLLLIGTGYIWARLNLRGLSVEVNRHTDRVQAGDPIAEELTISNNSAWPKLWLELEDPTELPEHQARFVLSLGSKQSRTRTASTYCDRRGVYWIGPARVRTGDPFGFFRAEQQFGFADQVLVYPRPLELTNFQVPVANLPGDGRFRRRTHYVTPNSSGVRKYEVGDSFNRIHWRSTARLGELMVKLFELDPASDVWIVLDLSAAAQAGEGDEGTEEVGVVIAASVARALLASQRAVGYLAYGEKLDLSEADRGPNQLTRILESLAMARATGDISLAELLYQEGRRFGRHTTLVAVTASTDEEWVTALQSLAQRGVRVSSVYMEPETFGHAESSLMVFGALMAADLPTHFVRKDDDLTVALSPTGQEANADRLDTIFGAREGGE
jgi:uncharacterized protein (DUF58 family)